MDFRQLKTDAQARGLNLGWLPDNLPESRAPMAPDAPVMPQAMQEFNPVAQQMLQAAQQQQAATPKYMPFASGTPTLDMKRYQEGARQFEEQMAFDRQRWAADQAHRAATLAAAQAATQAEAAMPKLNRETAGNAIQAYVDQAMARGGNWANIEGYLRANSHLLPEDLPLYDALRLAANYWHYTYPPQASGRWWETQGAPSPFNPRVREFLYGRAPQQQDREEIFGRLYGPDTWQPLESETEYWVPNPLNQHLRPPGGIMPQTNDQITVTPGGGIVIPGGRR